MSDHTQELIVWAYSKNWKWWPTVINPDDLEIGNPVPATFLSVFTR